MAVQLIGAGGAIQEVEPTFKAARVIVRPVDHGSLGAYSYGGFTGVIAAGLAANSEIFQFRWTDATRLAVVRKVRFSAAVSTTMFAAGVPMQIDLVKATGWTGQGTGGTGNTLSNMLRRRGNMGNSLIASGDMRIATTAGLGAGTKTLETLALSTIIAGCPITASLSGSIVAPGTILWQAEVGDGEHPLILGQNEGFVVRCVGVPATGTWQAGVTVDWAETTGY